MSQPAGGAGLDRCWTPQVLQTNAGINCTVVGLCDRPSHGALFPHRRCRVYSEVVAEPRDIVVIGGSAGAVEALSGLVASLPADLDAAVFVVVHTLPLGDSMLPAILSRKSALQAKVPADRDMIDCQQIYVAPPDCHLLLEPGRIKLSSGPKESGHR